MINDPAQKNRRRSRRLMKFKFQRQTSIAQYAERM